ncbi:imidazolonepropionase [Porphyromonas endodontalis]|uniref:Imidazolonepropionase n=1 Tax=Porphyromonas endodontalis (strain ATCC 35406 / DSM 24491 / JCM 8526 / CCUG 16442 / BCRC 14492 / NCTC 13058 / HG 370) TaxID=553175 RepID=C3J925_POREA|nr:imidazolonepropionase [Porphyromonas endodontalis]EEN83310.1 imidazolonepropionase [Porphyromonas endodontalis ATCC 35406]UBH64946.1 imidazolonepropionase [Porphyromonas endodontalis]SUB68459.1 Imidazolonepropionase [Porphyromonas endodontalis]
MSHNLYVKNIGKVATPKGNKAIHGKAMGELDILMGPAAIVIRDGIIAYVGKESEAPGDLIQDCAVYDAQGGAVVPGFVDSHTHLVFGGFREEEFQMRLRGASYMSIMQAGGGIASTTKATREASVEELEAAAQVHLRAMLSMGVTTADAKSGYGMDLETELRQLEVIQRLQKSQPIALHATFMGAHDTPPEFKGRSTDYIEYLVQTVLPEVKSRRLAECCDIFTEEGVFDHEQTRRLLNAARAMGFTLKMHADEIVPFGGAELAAELGCLSADHLLQISEKGIAALANSNTVATLLPCTAFSLKAAYAPARKMIDNGCAVAVASDLNPGSCFSASIPLMYDLACIYMGMTAEETLTALTLNGAAAIGRADRIGSIEVGKEGDLVVLGYPCYKFLSYHIGMNIVHSTIKGGAVYTNHID